MENNRETQKTPIIAAGVITLLVLLFCSSSGLYLFILRPFGIMPMSNAAMWFSRILFWLITVFAWLFAIKAECQPMLLWGNKKNNSGVYLVSLIVMVFIIFILSGLTNAIITALLHHKEKSDKLLKMVEIFRHNKALLAFTLITAGATEELLFRGYLLPRFALLFRNEFVAIFISSLLFALMHAGYGTITNVIGPFIIGVVCALHYLKYRNIVYLMIFHFLWDLMAFAVMFSMKP